MKHASDEQLKELLFDQEDTLESIEVGQHVETCETCQVRLSELTCDESLAQEAGQLLSGYSSGERLSVVGSAVSHRAKAQAVPEFDSVLLEPPRHPEMLGRIGRYEIERCIGSGGMGVVFKAMDTELNRTVAVKVLAPHLARNGAARQRFSRESRAAAAVVHEHVVAIHNVDSSAEYPYLVMHYVSGESLQARIDRDGPLAMERLLRIGIQAALGLAAAHKQGIIHRDIKPANMLLEDSVDRLLITDFGLARTVDDASLTHTGVVAGTPNYMSPEQAKGDEVDHRTDLFSLGAVLYYAATGHPPFRAERAMGVLHRICHERHRPVWQVNLEVPDELSMVIDRLLEKRPTKRYANAEAVAESLSRLLQQFQNRRPKLVARLRSWARRNREVAWSVAAVLIVCASLGAWSMSSLNQPLSLDQDSVQSAVSSSLPVVDEQNAASSWKEPSAQQDLGLEPTPRDPQQNTKLDDMLTADRVEFDRNLASARGTLMRLDRAGEQPVADSSQEFLLELSSLETSLNGIDPTRE